MWIISVIFWLGIILPAGYVLVNACKSMDGTMHGFNGEMLYGMDAFIDTILSYIVFLFPFFLLWCFCLLGTVIFTVVVCVRCYKKKSEY